MSDGYCAWCGTPRASGGRFCVSCGRELATVGLPIPPPTAGPFDVPDPFDPPYAEWEDGEAASPSSASSVPWQLLLALEITAFMGVLLTFLDEARRPTFVEDLFGIETIGRALFVAAVLPAFLMLSPRLLPSTHRNPTQVDARLVLVGAVSGLLVGCRSLAGLLDTYDYGFALDREGLYVAGLSLGLAGFAVFALSIPWNSGLKGLVASPSNPVAPAAGIVAAVVFLWCRYSLDLQQFVFSPASVSGPTGLEWVFLVMLVATGFMRSPYRQPVAFVLGTFSILSFLGNVLVQGGPVMPWPNPVTFACCLAMLHPFNEVSSRERAVFPARG